MFKIRIFVFVAGLALAVHDASALTVDTSASATQLAQKLVQGVSGITISSATYSGEALAKGIFSGGLADGLGIDSGIILSSGKAADAIGENGEFDERSTLYPPFRQFDPGDADLQTLNPNYAVLDVAALEFNFTASSSEVAFTFTFASEEYLEYVTSAYNDLFAFFIDGQNIALVPGTTDPISVNTVNPGSNSQYYRDNPEGSGNIHLPYDGLTVVIVVTANVTPNVSHHVKLGIADVGLDDLDSTVFIRALAPVPTQVRLATLITTGGWIHHPFLNGGGSQLYQSTTASIATSHLQNPAPQAVYRQLQAEASPLTWTANNLSPNSTYKVRVHLSSINFPEYSHVRETLTVTDANGTYSIPGVSPYGSGGFNVGMIVTFPQNFVPTVAGQISGSMIPTGGFYNLALVNGVEILKNP